MGGSVMGGSTVVTFTNTTVGGLERYRTCA